MATSRAIVYVVSGKEHIKQAIRSVNSIKDEIDTIVFTTGTEQVNGFTHTYVLPERQYKDWLLDRVRYFNYILDIILDYQQFLFLDSDTYVCDSLMDHFNILDRYDIAGTQSIAQQTLWRDDIPASFPELHCGALAVDANHRAFELFQEWLEIYQSRPKYFGNDQPPLRQALWENEDIKLGILPQEFCFRFRWGGLLARKVKLLHGKENNANYEDIAKKVNAKSGIRVYHRRDLA